MRRATQGEIDRRRHECEMNGHDFLITQVFGKPDPVLVICSRCGRSWGIVESPNETESQYGGSE